MAKINFFLIFLLTFSITISVFAHVCDDVLRKDPIVIWPERQTIEIQKTGQFKIFLRNDYWSNINEVKLIVPKSPFKIWVSPSLFETISPGEKIFFLVHLTIPEKMKPGTYPLLMKVNAQEFKIPREINLTIKVKEPTIPPPPLPQPEPQVDIEIVPEEIPVAISVFPDEIDIEPGESKEFKVYLRSSYDKPLHNITLLIDKIILEEFKFEIEVSPAVISELRPDERKFFLVNLKVLRETKKGEYILPLKFKADEFSIERPVCDVVIRVDKVWEGKTYLYLLIILFLVLVVIWQSLKRKKILNTKNEAKTKNN